jgi:SAM-dependent methyltransferase
MPVQSITCPICSRESTRLFQKHGYWIRSCKTCRHRFAEIDPGNDHIKKIYGDDYFFGGGDGYPDYLAEAELLRAHGRRYGKLLRQYMKPGLLLDVGCAAGFIMQGFQEAGWKVQGIEPNEHMAGYAQQQGLDVTTETLEEFHGQERFDLITMIQVLPHFYDLRLALDSAKALTKPGGYWLIETWDRDSLTARLFGEGWHEYSPPSVLHWFSSSKLTKFLASYGYKEISRGRPIKQINFNHGVSLLENKLRGTIIGKLVSGINYKTPRNMSVPYFLDDLFWAIYIYD